MNHQSFSGQGEAKQRLRSMFELARMAEEQDATDVLGSYTGTPRDGIDPVQDADDL